VLRNESAVLPVSTVHDGLPHHPDLRGVALSLPSVVNAEGVARVLDLEMSPDEEAQLAASADALRSAQASLGL